ncbi:GDSL-type esterase/lipase family protein [Bosea rubneri]|uniref:GDSL-type esterase/lipase family protein n=1 Tax=Bosea rubneri TaxID=3075434 RepID=A0ABU3S2S1_9HYPH|nr:GDSL-type esterase/lipase family protein [Bosea sp. ZW T0_25]MDU0339083.1 GDSL-type esterase/lipase family protein [Bosea sp. ZW T0_25]
MRAYALCLFLALLPTSTLASDIVALGASNTLGRGKGAGHGGVERSQAYPAQLQSMLSQQGCKVRVVNAGVAGDTPSGMAARLPKLLTRQTRVVILQPGGNDSGPDRANAIAQIERTLSDRKIALVMLDRPGQLARAYQLRTACISAPRATPPSPASCCRRWWRPEPAPDGCDEREPAGRIAHRPGSRLRKTRLTKARLSKDRRSSRATAGRPGPHA